MIALNSKKSIFLLLGLLLTQQAWPIGRIGNQKLGDPIEGFTAPIPTSFPSVISSASDRGAQLLANAAAPTAGMLTMIALPFSKWTPNLVGQSPKQVRQGFENLDQFVFTEVRAPNCATFLLGENSVGFIGIAMWGQDRGYVVTVQKSGTGEQIGKRGILDLLSSTQIENPCGR
jgi:hypothetical protein